METIKSAKNEGLTIIEKNSVDVKSVKNGLLRDVLKLLMADQRKRLKMGPIGNQEKQK